VGVEALAERSAITVGQRLDQVFGDKPGRRLRVVGEGLGELLVLEVGQSIGDVRQPSNRVAASGAVVGIRTGEQRVLLGGNEAVD